MKSRKQGIKPGSSWLTSGFISYLLVIMKMLLWTFAYRFVWTYVFISLGETGVGTQEKNTVIPCSPFEEVSHCLTQWNVPLPYPYQQCIRALISPYPRRHLFSTLFYSIIAILDDGSKYFTMIFNSHFPSGLITVLIGHPLIFREISIQVLCPF